MFILVSYDLSLSLLIFSGGSSLLLRGGKGVAGGGGGVKNGVKYSKKLL